MKKKTTTLIVLLLIAVIVTTAFTLVGCSAGNDKAGFNTDTGQHFSNWYTDHRAAVSTDFSQCIGCHGTNLRGGISGVSCFSTSLNGLSCHGHPANWALPDNHGSNAKSAPNASQGTGFSSCQACHGSSFTGGQLSTQTCLNTNGCHGAAVAAPHSPADWRTGARTHTTTHTANAAVCALCHAGQSPTPAPPGTQPGCMNNTLCHGQVGAPHAVPFTAPALHGPPAKADLTYCEGCHANPSNGGPGSNPRFNVAIGSLATGCEGCHTANYAHPPQWRGLTATAPGGHMTAGNLANACALCHGVNLAGGVGAACSTCHTAGSPVTTTNCTSCHGNPPTGAVSPNREGSHTEHNALTGVTGVCNICHNGAGTGTANHDYGSGVVNVSFLGTTYNAESGAAAYNAAGFTCSNVSCHGGQTTPSWLTGTINVNTQCTLCHVSGTTQFNSYNSGRHNLHINNEGIGCTECHDTTKLATVHFNDLNTPAMTQANLTLLNALNYTGTSCDPACHGSETW